LLTQITRPQHCPSCNSILEWLSPLLYCRNSDCASQSSKKVEHFAKTLKIKGLGPAAIKRLDIRGVDEIYSFTEEELCVGLDSDKLGSKLFAEIENSKNAPLNTVLAGFSIPLIGKTASEKLSSVCDTIYEINEQSCTEAGLGPKSTESLTTWLDEVFYPTLEGSLPFSVKFNKSPQSSQAGIVCISGKLKSFKTKADATTCLKAAGFEVKTSVTKDVTHLVNESGIETAKTEKARLSGITIIENLKSFLEE